MRELLLDYLKWGFELGVKWSNDSGQMADPYENDRPENFAPSCWSVIGAGLYRLTGEQRYLDWTQRWMNRSIALFEQHKTSPVLREYLLGYNAQVFPILSGHCDESILEQWRKAIASTNTEEVTDLYECHVSATALNCDLFTPLGREEAAQLRAQQIIDQFKGRMTEKNFLKDDDVNGNAITHTYLAGSLAAATLQVKSPNELEKQVIELLERIGSWFKQANGYHPSPVFSNRSAFSFFGYGTAAHLIFVWEGEKSLDKVQKILEFVRSFHMDQPLPPLTPNYLSPYATAGLEWTFNRMNTDLGAGLVGWTQLALLFEEGWKGFDGVHQTSIQPIQDEDAGYAFHHADGSRLALTLVEHDWQYHLSLQPVALSLSESFIEPIIPAKREGQKQHHYEQFKVDDEVDPFVEPYFGVVAKKAIDLTGRKNWWANGSYRLMKGKAQVLGEQEYRITESLDVTLTVNLENQQVQLGYQIQGLTDEETPILSIPVLLWDGQNELRYSVSENSLDLEWKGERYQVSVTGNDGAWLLHIGRHFNSGLGVSDNFIINLEKTGDRAEANLTIKKVQE